MSYQGASATKDRDGGWITGQITTVNAEPKPPELARVHDGLLEARKVGLEVRDTLAALGERVLGPMPMDAKNSVESPHVNARGLLGEVRDQLESLAALLYEMREIANRLNQLA